MTDDYSRHTETSSARTTVYSFVVSATLVVISGPVVAFGILSTVGSFATDDATVITAISIGIVTSCICVAVYNFGILPLIIDSSDRGRFLYPLVVGGVSFLLTALTLDLITFAPDKPISIDIVEIMAWILGIALPLVAFLRESTRNTLDSEQTP